MNEQHSLISRQFFRCRPDQPYVRHDLRVWENAGGRAPQLRDGAGKLLLGDALVADWRTRITRGTARVRGYYDVHPDKDSRLTLDPASKNRWGDPMPRRPAPGRRGDRTRARGATRQHFQDLFAQLAKANDGRIGNVSGLSYQDHPGGGCRMGTDPATSVVDSDGRTHDHENLFVVGSPTLPTGGCTNGTLTFVALALRSATEIARPNRRTRADRGLFEIRLVADRRGNAEAREPIERPHGHRKHDDHRRDELRVRVHERRHGL